MLRPVVVGSGHAGTAAALELVRLGLRPIVVDVGRVPDPAADDLAEHDRGSGPSTWSLRFGSAHAYAPDDDPALPTVRARSHAPVGSLAHGGLSNVWSGAMLPAHDADMADWPIDRADLAPHYRRVLASTSMSGDDGTLEREFPRFCDGVARLAIPPSAERALQRLEEAAPMVHGRPVLVGRARLALRAAAEPTATRSPDGLGPSATSRRSIDATGPHLARLAAEGRVDYRRGLVVRSVEEVRDRVVVRCAIDGGGREDIHASAAFVAAGAIGSTRILLETLELWDQPRRLSSAHGFLMPALVRSAGSTDPAAIDGPSFFVELRVDPSPHWIHVQVSPPKAPSMGPMGGTGRWRDVGERVLRRSAPHLLVAMCNLHSSEGGHHLLTLSKSQRGGPPVLRIDTVDRGDFAARARQVGAELGPVLRAAGMAALPPWGPLAPSEPRAWHIGSTLPMREHPVEAWETDVLGRPRGFARTHVVDAAVLPSIPATTIALVSMANATRIVCAAMGG